MSADPFPPLPPGWECRLLTSGRYIFLDEASSTTTFSHPTTRQEYHSPSKPGVGRAALVASGPAAPRPATAFPDLPPGWVYGVEGAFFVFHQLGSAVCQSRHPLTGRQYAAPHGMGSPAGPARGHVPKAAAGPSRGRTPSDHNSPRPNAAPAQLRPPAPGSPMGRTATPDKVRARSAVRSAAPAGSLLMSRVPAPPGKPGATALPWRPGAGGLGPARGLTSPKAQPTTPTKSPGRATAAPLLGRSPALLKARLSPAPPSASVPDALADFPIHGQPAADPLPGFPRSHSGSSLPGSPAAPRAPPPGADPRRPTTAAAAAAGPRPTAGTAGAGPPRGGELKTSWSSIQQLAAEQNRRRTPDRNRSLRRGSANPQPPPPDEWRGLLQAGGGYSEIYASPDSPTPPSLFLGEYYPAALASPHRSEPASGRLGAAGAGAPAAPYPAPSMTPPPVVRLPRPLDAPDRSPSAAVAAGAAPLDAAPGLENATTASWDWVVSSPDPPTPTSPAAAPPPPPPPPESRPASPPLPLPALQAPIDTDEPPHPYVRKGPAPERQPPTMSQLRIFAASITRADPATEDAFQRRPSGGAVSPTMQLLWHPEELTMAQESDQPRLPATCDQLSVEMELPLVVDRRSSLLLAPPAPSPGPDFGAPDGQRPASPPVPPTIEQPYPTAPVGQRLQARSPLHYQPLVPDSARSQSPGEYVDALHSHRHLTIQQYARPRGLSCDSSQLAPSVSGSDNGAVPDTQPFLAASQPNTSPTGSAAPASELAVIWRQFLPHPEAPQGTPATPVPAAADLSDRPSSPAPPLPSLPRGVAPAPPAPLLPPPPLRPIGPAGPSSPASLPGPSPTSRRSLSPVLDLEPPPPPLSRRSVTPSTPVAPDRTPSPYYPPRSPVAAALQLSGPLDESPAASPGPPPAPAAAERSAAPAPPMGRDPLPSAYTAPPAAVREEPLQWEEYGGVVVPLSARQSAAAQPPRPTAPTASSSSSTSNASAFTALRATTPQPPTALAPVSPPLPPPASYTDPAPHLAVGGEAGGRLVGPRPHPKTPGVFLTTTLPPHSSGQLTSPPAGEPVTLFRYEFDTATWQRTPARVRLDPYPWQEGALRHVYYMKNLDRPLGPEQDFVVKWSKNAREPRDEYFLEARMQATAQWYGEQFNRCNPPRQVRFLSAWVMECSERCGPDGKPLVLLAEKYIAGTFVKYTNNFGWVNPKFPNASTPQAFSHFTFNFSEGLLVVADIQGFVSEGPGPELYTDPQINTIASERPFGKADMRQRGIDKFFESHACNAVCQHWDGWLKASGLRARTAGRGMTASPTLPPPPSGPSLPSPSPPPQTSAATGDRPRPPPTAAEPSDGFAYVKGITPEMIAAAQPRRPSSHAAGPPAAAAPAAPAAPPYAPPPPLLVPPSTVPLQPATKLQAYHLEGPRPASHGYPLLPLQHSAQLAPASPVLPGTNVLRSFSPTITGYGPGPMPYYAP